MVCRLPLTNGQVALQCHFSRRSFPLKLQGAASLPCHTIYHEYCFKVTAPFCSRLTKDNKGLGLPRGFAAVLPVFICECCTVRAVLGRELWHHPRDDALLLLERMRQIDMAHNWAPSTVIQYKGKLAAIRRFEQAFRFQVLRTPLLTTPPVSDSIPLMWAQQHYSLQRRTWSRSTMEVAPDMDRLSFSTVRSMRSAAAMYNTLLTMVENPGQVVRDPGSSRPTLVPGCVPTDGIDYAMMTQGMSRRLGTGSTPSVALMARHIFWIDKYLNTAYASSRDPPMQRELAQAGLCNLFSWLAWLRGSECFGLRWKDLSVILPGDEGTTDLVGEMGAILLRLLEQTKSNRSATADVPIAFSTSSGLQPGQWLLKVRAHSSHTEANDHPDLWETDSRFLFSHHTGLPWDSSFYRSTYLIPLLQAQRLEGDPYLREYDGSPGKSMAEAFYSMHSSRRGGRSHVSKRRVGCIRKATIDEINEHGRWRRKRSSESMAEQYRQWELEDRLAITLLCF